MRFASLTRFYRNTAVVLLNTIVALVVINVLFWAVIAARYRWFHPDRDNPVMQRYASQNWSEVYPGLSEEDAQALLHETWSRRQQYDPVTQHAERPFSGRFVNVNEHGFREQHDQGPWPPDDRFTNVFLFGGSTAFGYGVPDDQTLAAYLQRAMRARTGRTVFVYNFGNASFASLRERLRFEQLLFDGNVPDVAIFLDGINEFAFLFRPDGAKRLRAVYDGHTGSAYAWAFDRLPMVRAGRAMKRRLAHRIRGTPTEAAPEVAQPVEVDAAVGYAIEHYLANRRLIEGAAASYGVSVVFVWQPAPMYKCPPSVHPFAAGGFPNNRFTRSGYELLAERVAREPMGTNFLWCADLQESLDEHLFVDKIHYSPVMNRYLAEEILARMSERGLMPATVPE